ncbi:CheY-like receiver [Candidatus Terasakiella magnetica]|nr:CheY-like receiver [Candidatus Terasakiella magnetica]
MAANQRHQDESVKSMFPRIRRALVVDDAKPMRELIRIALGSFHCRDVIEVEDGTLAFGAANIVSLEDGDLTDGSTDIVFLDWMMPMLDGIACTKLIRSGGLDGFNADVPIVMVTARTEDECERTALDAGVTVFVRKPVSLRSLSAGIAEALTKTPQKVLV